MAPDVTGWPPHGTDRGVQYQTAKRQFSPLFLDCEGYDLTEEQAELEVLMQTPPAPIVKGKDGIRAVTRRGYGD